MCGIFAFLNNKKCQECAYDYFMKGVGRGPDTSRFQYNLLDTNNKTPITIGFHRLAINGYGDDMSDQPFDIDDCTLICNGEIYNWKELYEKIGVTPSTKSDCEIIIHLYRQFGIEYTLQLLDGVFAFILFDTKKNKLFVARDLYGVRPLFIGESNEDDCVETNYYFASEMKQITFDNMNYVKQFTPGTYSTFHYNENEVFTFVSNKRFLDVPSVINTSYKLDNPSYYNDIYNALSDAVEKRVDNTDRELCCLLSGGLDSSLITALVNKHYTKYNPGKKLHTWSIGMKGSEDLKYAQKVADYLGTAHHAIELEKSEFLEAISEVVYTIESYDTTTVRASVGNWLVSKYIKNCSDAKVVFNGDGSDEVCGGYIYFHCAPNCLEFDKECKRLLKDIHYFDVLRSDRSISSHGLEARTPFLDKNFVQTYLSLPPHIRNHSENNQCEKYILRKAFDRDGLLPKEVLWRTKEAFSDGVSSEKEAWFETIQKKHKDEPGFYKQEFLKHYSGREDTIPYYWMPRFVEATDASARTLDIYSKVNNSNDDTEKLTK